MNSDHDGPDLAGVGSRPVGAIHLIVVVGLWVFGARIGGVFRLFYRLLV